MAQVLCTEMFKEFETAGHKSETMWCMGLKIVWVMRAP